MLRNHALSSALKDTLKPTSPADVDANLHPDNIALTLGGDGQKHLMPVARGLAGKTENDKPQ